ncbi:MAG: hypothetical protein AAGF07_00355 [Patescibacteria group bacterium]
MLEHTPINRNKEKFEKNENQRELLKKILEAKINKILDVSISPETMNSFSGELTKAIDKLVELSDEVLANYVKAHPQNKLEGKELEDAAYQYFKLTDVEALLDEVQGLDDLVSNQIENFIANLNSQPLSRIITPTDPNSEQRIIIGSGVGMEIPARTEQRLKTLLTILVQVFQLDLQQIEAKTGILDPNMIRENSYTRLILKKDLNTIIYVNDEVGNATHIFYIDKLLETYPEQNIKSILSNLDNLTKQEKEQLITQNPRIGVRMRMSKNWSSRIINLLSSSNSNKNDLIESEDPVTLNNLVGGSENIPESIQAQLLIIYIEQKKHWPVITRYTNLIYQGKEIKIRFGEKFNPERLKSKTINELQESLIAFTDQVNKLIKYTDEYPRQSDFVHIQKSKAIQDYVLSRGYWPKITTTLEFTLDDEEIHKIEYRKLTYLRNALKLYENQSPELDVSPLVMKELKILLRYRQDYLNKTDTEMYNKIQAVIEYVREFEHLPRDTDTVNTRILPNTKEEVFRIGAFVNTWKHRDRFNDSVHPLLEIQYERLDTLLEQTPSISDKKYSRIYQILIGYIERNKYLPSYQGEIIEIEGEDTKMNLSNILKTKKKQIKNKENDQLSSEDQLLKDYIQTYPTYSEKMKQNSLEDQEEGKNQVAEELDNLDSGSGSGDGGGNGGLRNKKTAENPEEPDENENNNKLNIDLFLNSELHYPLDEEALQRLNNPKSFKHIFENPVMTVTEEFLDETSHLISVPNHQESELEFLENLVDPHFEVMYCK